MQSTTTTTPTRHNFDPSLELILTERALQALKQGRSCVLQGTREVREGAMDRLQILLNRSGLPCHQLSLAGVAAAEFPWLLARKLGLGAEPGWNSFEIWNLLADYFAAAGSCELRSVCCWKLAHVTADVAPALLRLMFSGGDAVRHVFSVDAHGSAALPLLLASFDLQLLNVEDDRWGMAGGQDQSLRSVVPLH